MESLLFLLSRNLEALYISSRPILFTGVHARNTRILKRPLRKGPRPVSLDKEDKVFCSFNELKKYNAVIAEITSFLIHINPI
eukprot:scaffold2021_cov314-Chaetoceros_neogracile.AAC.1